MASRPGLRRPSRKFPTRHHRMGTHREPAQIHRVRAGGTSRGVTQPVPYVYLPVSLTAPGPSGSPEPTRLCRGCSHPPRRPPDQAASSFTSPLRRQRDGRSLTSIRQQQRLVAHSNRSQPARPHWPAQPGESRPVCPRVVQRRPPGETLTLRSRRGLFGGAAGAGIAGSRARRCRSRRCGAPLGWW